MYAIWTADYCEFKKPQIFCSEALERYEVAVEAVKVEPVATVAHVSTVAMVSSTVSE